MFFCGYPFEFRGNQRETIDLLGSPRRDTPMFGSGSKPCLASWGLPPVDPMAIVFGGSTWFYLDSKA